VQKTLLTFVEGLYEDLELWYLLLRLQEAGYAMYLFGPELRTLISSRTPRDLAPLGTAIVDFLQANARCRGGLVGPGA
jgi:hypothetical protein